MYKVVLTLGQNRENQGDRDIRSGPSMISR